MAACNGLRHSPEAMSLLKPTNAPSPTPSSSSTGDKKRKRPEASVVYSQPDETGQGHDILTNLFYLIKHLKEDQRWYTQKEILDYINYKEDTPPARQMIAICRKVQEGNQIEWDPRKNLYRFKPKYEIRDAAQLKGWLQNQKSAVGLPVKDLKEGWPNAVEGINELEKKHEVLVGRHKKDAQPKTVWINDPSLMHKMDPEFQSEWHKIPLPPNPDDLRAKLLAAGLQPSSAARKVIAAAPTTKKRKTSRRGGKQTNTHMAGILKDFSGMRK